MRRGAGLEDRPALRGGRLGDLPDQARLADARLAHQRDDLAVPRLGALQRFAYDGRLGLPPGERGEAARRRRLEAGPHDTDPDKLGDLHRLGQPLDRHRAERTGLDEALGQPEGLGGEADRAGGGDLLHPSCQVDRLAQGGVVQVQVVGDHPHDDLAAVQPDPHADLDAVPLAGLLGVPRHALLHRQRGVAGADGVVLVGDRRPNRAIRPSPISRLTVPS